MSQSITPEQAMLVLNGLAKVGPVSQRRLLDAFDDDPVKVLNAGLPELKSVQRIGYEIASTIVDWKQHFDLAKEETRLKKIRHHFYQ